MGRNYNQSNLFKEGNRSHMICANLRYFTLIKVAFHARGAGPHNSTKLALPAGLRSSIKPDCGGRVVGPHEMLGFAMLKAWVWTTRPAGILGSCKNIHTHTHLPL